MPKDRKKKTPSAVSHIEDSLDSLGVTQLLDELKDVPSVGVQDSSYSLEEVLAEFGSGKNSELFDAVRLVHSGKDVAKKSGEKFAPGAAPQKKPSGESSIPKGVHAAIKPAVKDGEPKKARLITDIIRPWEDGKYGDMKLDEMPKTSGKGKNPQVEDAKAAADKKKDTKPLGFKFSDDTLTRIRSKKTNSDSDNTGFTRGFRIKRSKQEIPCELPGDYVKREEKGVKGLKSRVILMFLLCLPLLYMTVATQYGWFMPGFAAYDAHPFRYTLLLFAAQLIAMLFSMDILADGIASLFSMKPKAESVIAVSAVFSLLHAGVALLNHGVYIQQPYCTVVCINLLFALWGIYRKKWAWVRACKTAGATKEPTGVFIKEFYGDKNVFKHEIEDRETFVGHLIGKDAAENFWRYFSAIVIVASIVFAAVASYGKDEKYYIIWALAAISSLSAPFFTLLCYSNPFAIVTKKLSGIGAAIAGWYAVSNLKGALKIILRDTDVFPHGCVKIHGLKVLGRHSLEKTLAYTTSIIKETRSGLYKVFAELLKSHFGRTESVHGLKHHESGGVEAVINGDKVFLGTSKFMFKMGISVNKNVNVKNAVFIAINSELAGVFNISYKINSEVQNGFDAMKRRKIQMVLATVDFNLTPMMVEGMYGLNEGKLLRKKRKKKKKKKDVGLYTNQGWQDMAFGDSYLIYPEIERRLDLSSDEQTIDKDACAVVARGGFAPMAFSVIAAHRLKKATIRNIVMSAISAVLGMLLMFYLTFCASIAAATPDNVILYMVLWTIAEFIISRRAGDF